MNMVLRTIKKRNKERDERKMKKKTLHARLILKEFFYVCAIKKNCDVIITIHMCFISCYIKNNLFTLLYIVYNIKPSRRPNDMNYP